MRLMKHRSGPGCILADKADIDAARQVRRREVGRVARIENLRALRL